MSARNGHSSFFDLQWKDLLEAVTRFEVLDRFEKWDIDVYGSAQRVQALTPDERLQVDALLEGERQLIAIKVRFELGPNDVRSMLADMTRFQTFFPRFRNHQIYVGIAALDFIEAVEHYAMQRGLFVLSIARDGSVRIKNDSAFRPKDFAAPIH